MPFQHPLSTVLAPPATVLALRRYRPGTPMDTVPAPLKHGIDIGL